MTRARSPRLPRHRMAPGQLGMFDPTALRRAERRYPEALHRRPTATGRVLSVLPGGATPAPTPAVAVRRAA